MQSMTGYGRGVLSRGDLTCTVEVRSLNHRYRDVSIKLARHLASLEGRLNRMVMQRFERGRFDITVNLQYPTTSGRRLGVDLDLARQYLEALRELQVELSLPGEIGLDTLVRFREMIRVEEVEPDVEGCWKVIEGAVEEALANLMAMRRQEGEMLAVTVSTHLAQVQEHLEGIKPRLPLLPGLYRQRLQQRLQGMLVGQPLDPGRLEQEVALFADRCDVSEELTRLESHLREFHRVMQHEGTVGRKLDFLLQEMHREVNTLGTKSADLPVAQHVVEIKAALEKVREQLQNVE